MTARAAAAENPVRVPCPAVSERKGRVSRRHVGKSHMQLLTALKRYETFIAALWMGFSNMGAWQGWQSSWRLVFADACKLPVVGGISAESHEVNSSYFHCEE
jgi:hypothetical protein